MKNLKHYVETLNGWNKLFGGEMITFPLAQDVKDELLERVECDLSPENLTCDGELPKAQVAKKAAYLNAVLSELQTLKVCNKVLTSPSKAIHECSTYAVYNEATLTSPFMKNGKVQEFANIAVAKAMRARLAKLNPALADTLTVTKYATYELLATAQTV